MTGNGQTVTGDPGVGETRVGGGEEKESNMSAEEQADEQCMGNVTGSKIVGACQEAAVMALR